MDLMVRRHAFIALLSLTLLAFGVSTQGCSHKSGRKLSPTSSRSADLVVKNKSLNSINVYVDGAEIGKIKDGDEGRFQILSGEREVEVREAGQVGRHSFGTIHFGFDLVEVTYRP
jgi:hypothetical protein